MSKDTQKDNPQTDDPTHQPAQTPLELVREQQSIKQHNKEVAEERVDATSEIPGHSIPSDIRRHPQRIKY